MVFVDVVDADDAVVFEVVLLARPARGESDTATAIRRTALMRFDHSFSFTLALA